MACFKAAADWSMAIMTESLASLIRSRIRRVTPPVPQARSTIRWPSVKSVMSTNRAFNSP